MAGENTSIDSFSNRMLWQLISGTGVLRPKELIEHELNKNKLRLLYGLLYYKTASSNSEEKLKKERNVTGRRQLDFVLKLSQFLDLDPLICHDLFAAFLVNDYRGSKQSLKQVLSHERHSQALMLKIRDFYYTERLYLLRCLRQIFVYWDSDHPYRNVYGNFMKSLQENGENIQEKILKQITALCQLHPPSEERNGPVMTNTQVMQWVCQNLKEQCELLEAVLILNEDIFMKSSTLVNYLSFFRKQGFGIGQTYKYLIDESTEKYIRRISCLESLIILGAMRVDSALESFKQESDSQFVHSKKEDFEAINVEVSTLGSDPVHSPIMLGWAMVRKLVTAEEEPGSRAAAETQKLGSRVLQLGVFRTLLDILKTEPFSGSGHIAAFAHNIIYKLLHVVLSFFQEDTLGNPSLLFEISYKLLEQPAVAQDVWDSDDGLWLLYESAMSYFPFDFYRFMNMTIALASASAKSAQMVSEILKELTSYTEYLDNNSEHDLQGAKLPRMFLLTVDKRPYPTGDFVLLKGSTGQVLELSGLPRYVASTLVGPLIRWETRYNGWSLLLNEGMELLRQITHGAGMVQMEQIHRATLVLNLLHNVLKVASADSLQEFFPFLSLCYDIVHRFSVLSPAPLDLLSAAVSCLACAAKHHSKEVWHKMMQTGLLPYLTENVDDLGELLSGRGLHAGMLGTIEAGTECTQARYPVTLAVLNMLGVLVQAFSSEGTVEELQACLLHILKEVFPLFCKWRYIDLAQRKQIGQQCLNLVHRVLNLAEMQKKADKGKSPRPCLHEVCVYSLLFTEAGHSLMKIVSTGVDNVEAALVQQGSLTEGGGVDLIELIQLSLSVLNRLLLLRQPDLPVSPVEQALSWQPAGRQSRHVVSAVAQYIYHRHHPVLPTLATRLLKRLAIVSPMSLLACLGNDAEPIRDMYLTRLQALSEDLRLKVAILELLSVCVETQPGLIEIFFDVRQAAADNPADTKKSLQLGRSSCLQTLLMLIDVQNQTRHYCPPDLLQAGLDLVHSLWRGRRETAMEVLRSKQSFWAAVTAPLKRDVTKPNSQTDPLIQATEVKIAAFSLRILAQEIYTVESVRVDTQLKVCLNDLGKNNRLIYWSQFVRDSLLSEAEGEEVGELELSEYPAVLLLKAWRNFLLVISRSKVVDDLLLTDSRKEQMMSHLLEGLQAQFSSNLTPMNMKLAAIMTALYYTLLRSWTSCIGKPPAVLVVLRDILTNTCSSSQSLLPAIQTGLVGALALLLQRSRLDSSVSLTPAAISTLLPVTCDMLLHVARQFPPPGVPTHTKMEISGAEEHQSKVDKATDSKLLLQVAVVSLFTEIVLATEPNVWLPYVQEHAVIAAVLVSLQAYIKAKYGMSYVHSVLLLLTAVASSEMGAATLAMSDFTAHTCLSVTHLYSSEDVSPAPAITTKVATPPASSPATWHGLYCLTLNLYTLMLGKLHFSFLEDALNFLGVHQERLQQSLDVAWLTLSDSGMAEAESTCNFLHEMALYRRQWRLNLPQTLVKILNSMINMLQKFISLLTPCSLLPSQPHSALQRILERGQDKSRQSVYSSPLLQHQSSGEELEPPSLQLIATEKSLLQIIAKCLAILRHFSPDLCQVLIDQSMDLCEYEPLVDLQFAMPSLDQETPLSFGSLISCVTACLRRLQQKEHKSPSPHRTISPHRKSPRPPLSEPLMPKSLLLFVMENCLTLTMTQACRYLREPSLPHRDKQMLKRELSAELNSVLSSILRHMRRGFAPGSPGDKSLLSSPHAGGGEKGGAAVTSTTTTTSSGAALGPATTATTPHSLARSVSQTTFSTAPEQHYFKLVQEFVKKVLR